MCKGPEARKASEHTRNRPEGSMPGEGQVREQGGEDKVGEAGVGTGSPSRLCLDSARQERKNQRAWKRGGWDLTLIIKLCL